jgi:predicted phage baseplate assembly protein
VTLVWEYRPPNSDRWQPLTTFSDETAAFTQEGYIEVEGPADAATFAVHDVTDPHVWLRCRLVAGVYAAGTVPEIAFLRPNAVAAENLATVRDEILGDSDGEPDQTFTLRRRPVRRETLALRVRLPDDADPGEEWTRVDDFLASGREALHYTLNPTAGVIRFGDGERGRIPPAGREIVATSYRYGGGRAGNVAAGDGALLASAAGIETVRNEREAVGGRDEEPLEELKERAPAKLRSRNRAVSAEDYTELARQAGGVARAQAFGLMHPDHPDVAVPGAVTVIIVPDHDDNPPRPSPDLKRRVAQFLHPYRLLTTELYVDEPNYRPVSIAATIRADAYASAGVVERAVDEALKKFLDPKKWAFGGDLYPTAFYNIILDVANVRAVDRLTVTVDGQPRDGLTDAVSLRRHELVYSAGHTIRVLPYEDR